MRKKHDVMRDLENARKSMGETRGIEDKKEQFDSACRDVSKFTEELNDITLDEAAERAATRAQREVREFSDPSKRFSFAKFIRQLSGENQSLDGVEAEMVAEGMKEAERSGIKLQGHGLPYALLCNRAFAGQSVSDPAAGGVTVATELQYQEALRNKLVLMQAGASYMGGLVGNIRLIQGDPVTMGWLGENDEGTDTKKTFTSRDVSPLRCFVNIPISKQLINQSSWDVEAMISNSIIEGHSEIIDTAALIGSGTSNSPLGILNDPDVAGVSIDADGGAISWKTVVDLETAIATKNADIGKMSYITNSKVRGAGKQTLKSAGVASYIWEGQEMNGYGAYVTNILPSNIVKGASSDLSPLVFGNFADLLLMQWGGLDFIFDPYTLKKQGAVEMTLNAYHNVFLRRKESFAVCKDIKA